MHFKTVLILGLFIFSSACASHFPRSPEEQAEYHAKEVIAAFQKGDNVTAGNLVDVALTQPAANAKIKELFTTTPMWRESYLSYFEKQIAEIERPDQSATIFERLLALVSSGIFNGNQTNYLFEKLKINVLEGNINGKLSFNLSDRIDLFPELKSPDHIKIIVNRSITALQDKNFKNRPVGALIEYAQLAGVDTDEGKRIEYLLPTMNIKREELDTVAKAFPVFAKARKEEITASVFLQVKNGDRLFSDDLFESLRSKVRGVDWVSSPGAKTTTLVVERVRNDEKTIPERTETITYAQHEVNLLGAVMLMPRNASYLYDVVSGGAEIEYGYVITAIADGGKSIYDEVVRGKVGGEYRRCQNSRIQNVFGGVSSAGFTANDDMRQRCSGPVSPSMDQLRKEVFSKIAESVLKVPPIKVAQDML